MHTYYYLYLCVWLCACVFIFYNILIYLYNIYRAVADRAVRYKARRQCALFVRRASVLYEYYIITCIFTPLPPPSHRWTCVYILLCTWKSLDLMRTFMIFSSPRIIAANTWNDPRAVKRPSAREHTRAIIWGENKLAFSPNGQTLAITTVRQCGLTSVQNLHVYTDAYAHTSCVAAIVSKQYISRPNISSDKNKQPRKFCSGHPAPM